MALSREQVADMIAESNRERDEQWRQLLQTSKADKILARKLKIDQEKAKYDKPQDKRAVGFIMDAKFDNEDLMDLIRGCFSEDGELTDNKLAADKALKFIVEWGEMRSKKLAREQESYDVANRSRYGWLTEKCYRQEDIFKKEDDEWWKSEDLTPAEKSLKFSKAETKARFLSLDQKKFDSKKRFSGGGSNFRENGKRSRWGPGQESASPGASSASFPSMPGASSYADSGAGGYVNFAPSSSFQPPRMPPKCFKCGEFGHIQKDCKK